MNTAAYLGGRVEEWWWCLHLMFSLHFFFTYNFSTSLYFRYIYWSSIKLGLIQSNNFCPLIRAFCLFTMNTTADIEVYYLTVCLAFCTSVSTSSTGLTRIKKDVFNEKNCISVLKTISYFVLVNILPLKI